MAFDIPLLTDQGDVAIATKIANALNSLRDGGAITYGGAGNVNTVGTPGGTGNAFTLQTQAGHTFTAYVDGHTVNMVPPLTNTLAVTMALDSLAAKPVVKSVAVNGFVALDALDIATNKLTRFTYSLAIDSWIMLDSNKMAFNNIGNIFTQDQIIEKLISIFELRTALGAMTVRFIEEGSTNLGRAYITSNAKWDGSNWNKDQTGSASWAIGLGGTTVGAPSDFSIFYAGPNPNPITFVNILNLDKDSNLKKVTLFEDFNSSGTSTASITFPTPASNDIINVWATCSMTVLANVQSQLVVTNITGAGLWKPRPNFVMTRGTGGLLSLNVAGVLGVTSSASLTLQATQTSAGGTLTTVVIYAQRFFA